MFHIEPDENPYELEIALIDDLKLDLEGGDSSDAGLLAKSKVERDHRKYIGNWLRNKALGRYTVPQEEELADAKRPDLRIHGGGIDGPVPIELKIADKWTGPQLFERLGNQLCGDYLRDQRSTCGIYLLTHVGEQQRWAQPGTARRLDFAELIAALQAHADELTQHRPDIDRVNVVGIDLARRTCARATVDDVDRRLGQ